MNSILDSLVLKIKSWGEQQSVINYILQTDVTNLEQVKENLTFNFFIATKNDEKLIKETTWLDEFGITTRKHAANHGFCSFAKATYDNGFKLHFVIVSTKHKSIRGSYYNIENLESSKKLIVNNTAA